MPIPFQPAHGGPLPPVGTPPDGIIHPLAGMTHLHTYPGGYHLADNLPGGRKNYYSVTEDGDISGMRIMPAKPKP